MAQGALRAAELGAEIIDINMDVRFAKLPVTVLVRSTSEPGEGWGIVAAIIERTALPVTVKIRADGTKSLLTTKNWQSGAGWLCGDCDARPYEAAGLRRSCELELYKRPCHTYFYARDWQWRYLVGRRCSSDA